MNATQRGGLALVLVALVGTATGCGGGFAEFGAPRAALPPAPPAYAVVEAPSYPSAHNDAPAPPPPVAAAPPGGMSRAENWWRPTEPQPRAQGPQERPGLGTEWGETRLSHISTVPFVRADLESPFATASL